MDAEEFGIGALAIVLAGVMFILSIAIIIACAMLIEWIIGLLDIQIDKTLYWTGVGLIILFGTFCKSSSKKDRD